MKFQDSGITPDRWQSKTLMLSTNVDQKLLKTEFLIAICCLTGDKWQSKTLFLAILDPHSSIVKSIFDFCLSGVDMHHASKDVVGTLECPYTVRSRRPVKHCCDMALNFSRGISWCVFYFIIL